MQRRLFLFSIFLLCGCTPGVESSGQIEARQQEVLQKQAVSQVGMPGIVNFQEKRIMRMILELRDQANLSTHTYIRDMSGKLHKLCDSIGFGLPYATQYTNPQMVGYASHQTGVATLPQADPNGLYSPTAAEGTWVLCQNPKKPSEVKPVYVEDRITTSPFPLE